MVRVWDIFVRVSHWAVALGFFVAFLTEDDLLDLHVWAGYLVGALVVLRILWGFLGTEHARFTDFIYGPRQVIAYLRDLASFRARRYLGHSPAGGAMAIILWLGLAAIVWSGLEVYAIEEGAGPLAEAPVTHGKDSGLLVFVNDDEREENEEEENREDLWEEVHEVLANLVMLLVVLHIAGVGFASVAHRENLVRSMINGLKRNL